MIDRWQTALDRLYGLANWETRPPGTEPTFELDRMRRILDALGRPEQRWPALHVAGTNGKGSTCAMLAAVLRQAGYRVGLYSSPHLHSLRERIQVDGQPISEAEVCAWLDAQAELFASEPAMTTFEALTALAFDHFAREAVDIAVVEVGLGGRLDSTNLVEPVVCAITAIGMDHAAVLGGTLAAIARDKAGILKPGVPAVIAPQAPEASMAIRAVSDRVGSPRFEVEKIWRLETPEFGPGGQVVVLEPRRADGRRYRLSLGLAGAFQAANAATAVAVLELLGQAGWRIDAEVIHRGLAAARWPARFERFDTAGVTGRRPSPMLLIDAAHNPPAAEALIAALDGCYPGRPRLWILGFSSDKDVDSVLATLLRRKEPVLAIRAGHPRAMSAEAVAALAASHGVAAEAMPSAAAAIDRALAEAEPQAVVVAAGSIFAAAELRLAWSRMGGFPVPPFDPPPPAPGPGG